MKKLTSIIALAFLLLASLSVDARPKKKAKTKPMTTIEILQKVNDQWQATHKPEVRSFWDDAAYFTGNMEAYKLTGNARYLEYSDKWARHNQWSGATERDKSKWLYKTYGEGQNFVLFGDWMICFQTYLDMYAMNPDDYKIARTKEVVDYMVDMPQNDFWWWADGLYMVMPVMTKMYKLTGDEKYLDKLYDNFKYADDLMFDTEDHLYYRDGKYIYPKHKSHNGKKDFWARGDGWVLAGLAKVLADMPESYKHYPLFLERYHQLAAAVAKCQHADGYWTRSMLDEDHADGPETSGTAFFTYGLLWGVNNGILSEKDYMPVVNKAWQYLTGVALQKDYTIGYVQPIGEKAIRGQQLTEKNTANFGTGAFLLAACEMVRYEDKSVKNANEQSFTVTATNELNMFRQEVVEIDANTVFEKLGISGGRQFKVFNAAGQEVAYQITHDKKILVDVAVRPCGTAVLTFKKGTPKTFVNHCYGRMYPERVDDIAWENDRVAYRCYGPALQRSGEKAYGIDVWLKNTPYLDVEKRYHLETINRGKIADLKKVDPIAAEELNKATSYHYDHGSGLDCYKVGPTLGTGTPALMDGENIIFPYCYKDYEILDNGPLRFTVKLTYAPTTYKGDTAVVENRIISLDKGSNFCKTIVYYEGLSSSASVVSGVVIHNEDTASVVLGENYVHYADPTDNPNAQNFQIYVAVLFPNNNVATKIVKPTSPINGPAGHALGVVKDYKNGEKLSYYFGSAWSKADCHSQEEWQTRINAKLKRIEYPLQINIK